MPTKKTSQGIPRYVVQITDTQTKSRGIAFNVAQGSDNLNDFVKFIPPRKRKKGNKGRTEFEAMLWWFAEQVALLNKTTPEQLTFNDDGKEGET